MPRRPLLVVAVLIAALAAVGTGALRAQEKVELARRMDALRSAAADRDLPVVERLAADLLGAGIAPDAADEARLLLGKTRLLLGRPREAVTAVEPLVAREASPWHVKALFVVADAAGVGREWQRAADIWSARVDAAAGDAHRAEIATLWRALADGAFEGAEVTDAFGRTSRVPDYAAARGYYEKVRTVHVAPQDAPLVAYRIGLSALESGQLGVAVRELEALLAAAPGDLADDALYALGRARLAAGDRPGARQAFADLRTRFGDSEFAPLALERTAESWWTGAGAEEARRATDAWREFLRLHPDHADAAGVRFRIAEVWRDAGRPADAAAAFLEFVARHGDDPRAPVAQDQAAAARLALGDFDGAVREWRVLLERWPDHPLWAGAQAHVAEASFRKGSTAFDETRDADARAALAAFLAAFPVDAHAPLAQRLLGDLEMRAGRHAAAVDAWRLAATKYPQAGEAPAAVLRIAGAYEGPLADLDKALAAYEETASRWPGSPEAARARQILGDMRARTLTARIERAFRTDETPAVALTLRNVPSLRMKAYRIEAAEYVRRRGGLAGVEQVDVDVVKPDHAWDFEVPDYARYRLLERSCPLPFREPGAYIVTASDDELTATFLALVSDLTVIVKASPAGGLVFVYDERSGRPVRGARVQLLDADLAGVTGDDGVWREDARALPRLRAIVSGADAYAGHVAYADAAAGSGAAFGYTTKVFLQTDRPLYRGGQTVHLRAIVRRVADGRYTTEEHLRVPVRVQDARGATLYTKELETDAYGIVADDVDLAPEPSLGTYTLLSELDGRTFTQTFEVQAFRKPDLLADIAPAQPTYLAGDGVEATLSVRYAVGGVASGAAVTWTVVRGPFAFDATAHQDFAWFFRDPAREEEQRRRAESGTELHVAGQGTTDRDGKLVVRFATDAVEEDRVYTLVAEITDPNRRVVRTATALPVTQRGVVVMCRTEKKVVRPGEAFTLEATVVNPLHVPVATQGEAVLVRRVRNGEHFDEEDVQTVAATTDARGRAAVELKAPRPGAYLAKFRTRDARGAQVEGAAELTVGGDAEDLTKQAKLVADREFYREGDVAHVLVNVPVAPVPVLLTYEGERVLGYRVFQATERSSTVDLPLSAEHAPNVFLRMAVAKEGVLHEAGDEVAVFQYLDVQVTPDRDTYRPGEPVTLTVRTTDQSGRPVRAELGVDVVDATLFALAADGTPQVKPWFYDQRRTLAVGTASSAGIAWPAVTRPTNPDLLFERMRRLGRERFQKMQEHVQRGREALQRGDRQQAGEELEKALEIEPGNYEARALRDALRSADKLADRKGAEPNDPPAPPTSGGPSTPGGRPMAPKPSADAAASDEMGVGGGGGGGYGGRRGGVVRRSRSGGGASKDAEKQDADDDGAAFYSDAPFEGLERVADYRARAENVFAGLSTWAATPELQASVLLAQQSLPLVPAELRERFEDTAASAPRVVTDAEGRGTLTFELPDNLTEWRVTARGASAGPLVGESRTSFRVTKPLLIRADAPRFLVAGDTTTATGTVHSSLDAAVRGVVDLRATDASLAGASRSDVEIAPGSVTPYDLVLRAAAHGAGTLRAEVTSTVPGDAAVAALPVLPRGLRALDGASGTLVEEAFAELELPERFVPGTASLTVTLAPSIDVALLESLAYTASFPYGCVEQTVNRFLPAVAAREALRKLDSAAFRRRDALDESVRRGLAALYALQADDGSFGWFGARGPGDAARAPGGDAEMTAYAVLGMLRAEQAGFTVSVTNRDRAVEAALRLVRGSSSEDRAFLLYALSYAGRADLADLNALQRERSTLTPRALALLSLALQRTGRPTSASELLARLATLAVRDERGVHWERAGAAAAERGGRRPHVAPDAEPTAYALLALLGGEPENALVDDAARWLAASRRGPAWRSTRDTAAAIEALAAHAASRGIARAACSVDVEVNGGEPVAATFGGAGDPVDAPVTVSVPARLLVPGKNRLVLRRRGTGEVHWSALLASVEAPPESGDIAAGGTLVAVTRDFTEWTPPALPGAVRRTRPAPGYDVVVPEKRPAGWLGRPLAQAAPGAKVRVTLDVTARAPLTRVLVEDPLPAGFEVVPDSCEGPFDRQERRDERQVFFLSQLRGSVRLAYVIQAVHPGAYDVLPATARAMYEPELHGWSRENRMGVAYGDEGAPEQITPDEVWGLARAAFDAGEFAAVRDAVRGLLAQWELRPEVAEEAFALLFRAALRLDDGELMVKAYEELLDRNPRRATTDLDELRRLATAYRALGEHERALSVLRDLVRAHFAGDSEVAEAYARAGNPWRARELLAAALRRAPDAPWAEDVEWRLAQRTSQMHVNGTGEAGPLMLTDAVADLRAFSAHHAGSSLAHEAGHLTVQLLLRMDLPAEAIEEGTRFLGRHGDSRYLDDVTFLVAEGQFHAGAYDRALAAAKPLLEREFPVDDGSGRREASPFRGRAILLTAQIAHARGDLARAAALYAQVAHLFPDARVAADFLNGTGLTLREVESVGVGTAPALHLRRRNVGDVQLAVYAVDFMILYALRPDLSQVNRVDLSGIRPVKEWTAAGRPRDDRRWSDEDLPLPQLEKGVYLVVARGGGLEASSIVLVSDLVLDVQRTPSGGLRVYATDRRTGVPVPEAYVKVGNGSSIQAQGFTDARGVFDADAARGTCSVVAEKQGDVALWRP